MKTRTAVLIYLAVISGCAHHNPPQQPSYAEQIAKIPSPRNEEDRQSKCSYIRSEIARQQNLAMGANAQLRGMYAIKIQAMARDNIATLESRASDFKCSAAFGERTQSNIDNCVAACKANTTR